MSLQNMKALAGAEEVRMARTALRRRVRSGEVTAADVLASVPWEAETMAVFELLKCQPGWGRIRASKLLQSERLSEVKRLGELTPRQRNVLIARLA